MAVASFTSAVAGQTITATYFNNTINAILNQLNGNLDEANIRDGVITALKLAVGAVDLSTTKVTGNIPIARFNSGTDAGATTFWRGDGTWVSLAQPVGGSRKNLLITRPTAATVTVTADELVVESSATGTHAKIASVSVTADITASGANGLDTGAEASGTWYYIYVIRKASDGTVAALLSASASSPTLPSGYTQFALVGAVRNDGSSNMIDFIQRGDEAFITTVALIDTTVTATSYADLDCSGAVPPNSIGKFTTDLDASAGAWAFRTNGAASDMFVTDDVGATGGHSTDFTMPVDASSIMEYKHASGSGRALSVRCYGFRFTR